MTAFGANEYREEQPDVAATRPGLGNSDAVPVHNGADLVEQLAGRRQAVQRIDADIVAVVAQIVAACESKDGEENLAFVHGHRSPATLVEDVLGVSARTARMLVRIATHTSDRLSLTGQPIPAKFPQTAAAIANGEIGIETAGAIVDALAPVASRALPDEFAAAESALTQMADGTIPEGPGAGHRHSCDLVRAAATVWRARIDPDGLEPDERYAHKNRSLWVSKRARRGLHQVGGQIPTELATKFHAICDGVMRQITDPDDASGSANQYSGDGEARAAETAPGVNRAGILGSVDDNRDTERHGTGPHDDARAISASDERRTPEQVGADVFAGMLTAFAGSDSFASPPAVLVTIPGDVNPQGEPRLAARTGTMADQPAARSTVEQLACDAGTQPVWLRHGAVLALGTAGRFFTSNQRRAIAARDGHTCLIRGCSIPASACEAHHVTPHSQGGRTHVNNGVLLCWHHHRMMDHGFWTITMRRGVPKVTAAPVRSPRYVPRM